jgi:hypothetical protein
MFTNAAAVTVTVPTNASVAFPIGAEVLLQQTTSAGQVGVVVAAGVNPLNSSGSLTHTALQSSVIALVKTATNTWSLTGDRA